MRPLNPFVQAAFERLPRGGGYRFEPRPRRGIDDPTNPRDPHYDGVSRDLSLDGAVVARGARDGATYCCGVTFEVWWWAMVDATGRPPPVDPTRARELLAQWFCPTMGHAGVAAALVDAGLGVAVASEQAEPGDFVQYWRSTDLAAPSGHSAVFVGWDDAGDRRRLCYASSQPATDGVGHHAEIVEPDWTLAFVRATFAGS